MPSTLWWLAVAVIAGGLVGLAVGHWSAVARWVHRRLEDPVARPTGERRPARDHRQRPAS